jgi:hypothetical protein
MCRATRKMICLYIQLPPFFPTHFLYGYRFISPGTLVILLPLVQQRWRRCFSSTPPLLASLSRPRNRERCSKEGKAPHWDAGGSFVRCCIILSLHCLSPDSTLGCTCTRQVFVIVHPIARESNVIGNQMWHRVHCSITVTHVGGRGCHRPWLLPSPHMSWGGAI